VTEHVSPLGQKLYGGQPRTRKSVSDPHTLDDDVPRQVKPENEKEDPLLYDTPRDDSKEGIVGSDRGHAPRGNPSNKLREARGNFMRRRAHGGHVADLRWEDATPPRPRHLGAGISTIPCGEIGKSVTDGLKAREQSAAVPVRRRDRRIPASMAWT